MSRPPADRPRIAILLAYEQDAAVWAERFARGETLDRTPYGYDLAGSRYELAWSASPSESRLARRIRARVSRVLGFDLVHAWRNRRMLFDADAIWTHSEREHLAVALLQRFRPRRRLVPVLAQSVWLWDEWERYGGPRRAFVAWLLRRHAIETVHSRVNLAAAMTVPGRPVILLPFGTAVVDRDPDGAPSGNRLVVAVGNDRHRDWTTLARAARALPEVGFRVASSSRAARRLDWPSNVTVAPATSRAELAALYAAASVIVIPVQPNRHASGATSLIEAMASGRPLVLTRTGGLDDYAGANARLVGPGDDRGLARAVRAALDGDVAVADPDSPAERGLTQADYVLRYVLVTEWLLGRASLPPEVSEFARVRPPST